ncbi:hypothetical protein H2248_000709 [Termitomyces sp. 'cryptogamus']|nr:hypothetical protein H2248_000709 [Termitomyces sp. 'cryptogamus']
MGFCRRCGDIVSGARCKCGGTAVAPVVPWNQEIHTNSAHDRWSKTYVERARSISPTRSPTAQSTDSPVAPPQASPTKRFPRPVSHTGSPITLDNRVSAHIASSTSHTSQRSPSPLKNVTHVPALEADILPSLSDATLSKVYGSVLQRKESLTTHSCSVCLIPFPPDATIYPDPASISSSRFLCRPCYETNGGTKGKCPTCSRPVLTLKSEGEYIHAGNQFWHKRCFNCSRCFKYIGETPMVDLLGRPSCPDCFESCLKRDPSTPQKCTSVSANNSPPLKNSSNIGGMGSASKAGDRGTREGSPAMEELQQRLGISGRRAGSPAVEDLSRRLAMLARSNPTSVNYSAVGGKAVSTFEDSRLSRSMGNLGSYTKNIASPTSSLCMGGTQPDLDTSPTPAMLSQTKSTESPTCTVEAIEEMKQKFIEPSSSGPRGTPTSAVQSTPPFRLSHLSNPKQLRDSDTKFDPQVNIPTPVPSQMPDLMSEFSDTTTQSSLNPESPPKVHDDVFGTQEMYIAEHGSSFARRDFSDTPEDVFIDVTSSRKTTSARTPHPIHSRATPSKHSGPALPLVSSLTSKPEKTPPQDVRHQSPFDLSTNSCAGCGGALFTIRSEGKFVTVPGDGELSITYHVECFKCAICNGIFNEVCGGQAIFVKANGGACHVECAPPAKMTIHKMPSAVRPDLTLTSNLSSSPPAKPTIRAKTYSTQLTSSRLERPPFTAPLVPGPIPLPRFGSSTICPGCSKPVFPMEHGVVPGPQNTRWHASCLVCGGKKEMPKCMIIRRGMEEKKTDPGCGKRLDSAAKTGADGGVWCRECLVRISNF